MSRLIWPTEITQQSDNHFNWFHAKSNLSLDFHGDPCRAKLVVYSDGNHHMALLEVLQAFQKQHPQVENIFYATVPPNILVNTIKTGAISIGNLIISTLPHVFIGPKPILDQLVEYEFMNAHKAFMKSQANVLLVKHGNPKDIQGIADLLRKDVRLFISNPAKEQASFKVYHDSIMEIARASKLAVQEFEKLFSDPKKVHYGECIHHREAPQAIVESRADVAMVYYHLALRYTRVFSGKFEYVYLGEVPTKTLYHPANVISQFHAGQMRDGGQWGSVFMAFLDTEQVTMIYDKHGLFRPDKFL